MEVRDKIIILLAEYNTLRQEVMAARTNIGQGVGIFFAAIMADIAFGFSYGKNVPEVTIIIAILAFFYIGGLVFWNEKGTTSFTRRIREIENEINNLAGERILVWETIHGSGNMTYESNPNFRGGYVTPEEPMIPIQPTTRTQIKNEDEISN
jgi:hypothetical protein